MTNKVDSVVKAPEGVSAGKNGVVATADAMPFAGIAITALAALAVSIYALRRRRDAEAR